MWQDVMCPGNLGYFHMALRFCIFHGLCANLLEVGLWLSLNKDHVTLHRTRYEYLCL